MINYKSVSQPGPLEPPVNPLTLTLPDHPHFFQEAGNKQEHGSPKTGVGETLPYNKPECGLVFHRVPPPGSQPNRVANLNN